MNGGEYLFQGKDDEEMSQWVDSINATSAEGEGGAAGGKAQTLPAEGSKGGKDKKTFFTLMGKK